MTRPGLAIGAAVLIPLAALPAAGPGYHLQLMTVVFYWIGLAGSWNLMSGLTGAIDFGSVTYVGVGAYAAGLVMLKAGWPLPAALALAGVLCLALALAVGGPTLRLKGAYFAIATLALAETAQQVCLEWSSLTHGGNGITIPLRLDDLTYYWLYLGLAAGVVGLTWALRASRWGYALAAIRQDEAAAARLGVDTHRTKLLAYSLSAVCLGLLGALDATRLGYITPLDAFNVHVTIKMVIMSLLGGLGTVLGPVAGAALLQVLEDILGAQFLNLYLVLVGAVIAGVVMFLPRGLLGGLAALRPGRE